MHTYPFVSVVVPVYNEEKQIGRLLTSVFQVDYPKNRYEVIIVDGGSTDKTSAIVSGFTARIFDNPGRLRGSGCQVGIDNSRGTYIAFTDADCVVPRNWLKDLVRHFGRNDTVAAVGGPNVTPTSDEILPRAVGDVMHILTRAGARYGYSGREVTEIFHNPGCNVVYRKSALLAVGGFNPTLMTCEDEELDFRLREQGYILLYSPSVIVDHYRRTSLRSVFIQAYRYALGRAQAIRLHPAMAKWFHGVPSLLCASLLLGAFAIVVGTFTEIGVLLYVGVIATTLSVSAYVSLTKTKLSPVTYAVILWLWFLGWGIGFVAGFIGLALDINRKK